jgi:PIN domain nuclease of toxin-antitoxin system
MPDQAVLDASAVLTFLQEEPGAEEVESRLAGSILPSVNLAEVLTRIHIAGSGSSRMAETIGTLQDLGVHIEAVFSTAHAKSAAELHRSASHLGLSLGDRACLVVTQAQPTERYALTADQAWRNLPAECGITVVAIR